MATAPVIAGEERIDAMAQAQEKIHSALLRKTSKRPEWLVYHCLEVKKK
jgi:hypothetical protein